MIFFQNDAQKVSVQILSETGIFKQGEESQKGHDHYENENFRFIVIVNNWSFLKVVLI